MADKEKILAALAQLDPLDDDQWTTDGSPKVETVSALVGETVKRQDIVNAAPDFNREKASAGDSGEGGNGSGDGDGAGEGDQDDGSGEGAGDGTEGDQGGDQPGNADGTTDQPGAGDDEEAQLNLDDDVDVDLPEREMSPAEFQAWLRTVPKEELEDIEAALKKQHDAVGLEVKKLQELQKRITVAVSMTRARIKEAFPNSADAHAIRSFIQSQTAARAARVERRQTILKGIRPEELDYRAPIDAAMARKTKRGTQRPVRPLVK